jgi:hypothetical protein
MKPATFALAVLLLAPLPARGAETDTETVERLYLHCKGDALHKLFCLGYIRGVADMMNYSAVANATKGTVRNMALDAIVACIPASASADALTQAFMNYAAKHPEEWSGSATFGAITAFRKTWPCE